MIWSQLFFFLMFCSPGVFLLWSVWRGVHVVKESKSWPSVPGRIIHTSCREDVTKSDENNEADTTWYTPIVRYEYQVGRRTYQGNRIAFSEERYTSIERASEVLGTFAGGHPVTVFYDPAKPRDAVLHRRNKENIFAAVAGWILVVMGIAMLFNPRLLGE